MPFQVSPGVNVSEIDLTTVVPAVSTTEGAFAGVFRWGPIGQKVLVDSEINLVARFGRPTNLNAETWFTAANFLSYGNKLYVVRAANTTTSNTSECVSTALANTGSVSNAVIYNARNREDYLDKLDSGDLDSDTDVLYLAKYPGKLGNSLRISVCDSSAAYESTANLVPNANVSSNISLTAAVATIGSNSVLVKVANSATGAIGDANTAANIVLAALSVGDLLVLGNTTIGKQNVKITSLPATPTTNSTHAYFTISIDNVFNLAGDYSTQQLTRSWEFSGSVDRAPGQSTFQAAFGNTSAYDELHAVVVDHLGEFTGVPGTILEVFEGLSRATDAKTEDGAGNYYVTVINDNSNFVWWGNDRSGANSATASALVDSTNVKPLSLAFAGGSDGLDEANVAIADVLLAYDQFQAAEDVDISLVIAGKARGGTGGEQLANYIIDNICEKRKDCVAFISPDRADVVGNVGNEYQDVVNFRNVLRSSSYAVLDSGYKYQYDKYNDVYRFIPLNGDTAGLCVRTDDLRDPWWSPAGFNRGQIKNIIKLAYNPRKSERDILYKAGVNPVVTFPGQGTILYGDKTLLAKPSAFDRINVRRLFIVLEKAIATAAKYTLFEFNDEFTRAQFRNMVEPFLRDVQGRRGIYDFRVVCDATNNTGEVIDRNEFVGDIYIKPARSINFIQLNFVAVRTGVEFSEIVGKF